MRGERFYRYVKYTRRKEQGGGSEQEESHGFIQDVMVDIITDVEWYRIATLNRERNFPKIVAGLVRCKISIRDTVGVVS